MLHIYDPVARPYPSVTIRALLILLFLAFAVNSVAASLPVRDYYIVNKCLDNPAPTRNLEIAVLQKEWPLRVVSRLAVSAVLLLGAAFFVWQRRRNLTMRGALHRVRLLAKDVLESIAQGAIVLDDRRAIIVTNCAAVRLLDSDPEGRARFIGHRLEDLRATGAGLSTLVDELAWRGDPVWDRYLTVVQPGLTRRLRADVQALNDTSGRAFGCVILLRDITMSLLTEERMRRMERIVGLGDAAAGLVHEIKNPLTALSIHLQLLEERLADAASTEPVRPFLKVLQPQANRLNHVLAGFWDYAQLRSLTVQPTDVVAVLERVIHLLRPEAERQRVRVELRRTAAPLLAVPLDPEKFEEAVWNLAINALEAMPEGGDLLIDVDDDGRLSVCVSDSGPGIPAEIQANIFKPYFSTKSRGTGLGLALIEKLVGQHHGGVDCRTGPVGTSFHITFPLDDRGRSRADDGRKPIPHPGRG
jgi:signal transduction histidine kinase